MTDQNTTDTTAQEPENGPQTAPPPPDRTSATSGTSGTSGESGVGSSASADETTTTPPDAAQGAQDASQGNAETFPREYVEKLRKEAAEARLKAKKADEYARELFAARVAATGRLADPTDLPFDAGHLDSPDALNAAIDALLDAKPHLASRVPRGNVGQGAGTASHEVDLAALLRRGA